MAVAAIGTLSKTKSKIICSARAPRNLETLFDAPLVHRDRAADKNAVAPVAGYLGINLTQIFIMVGNGAVRAAG